MRYATLAAFALAGITATSAIAQMPPVMDPATGARPGHDPGVGLSLPLSDRASNIGPAGTRSSIAPTLPTPAAGPEAGPRELLASARASLIAGRTGLAQQSLEMAETRLLDRSVPQGMTNYPSDSPIVAQIRDARFALGSGDSSRAILLIDQAMAQ